ncbi:hypothetical protein ACLB2K_046892 [Fragaria x ananassa]
MNSRYPWPSQNKGNSCRLCPGLFNNKEPNQGQNGESTEANRHHIKRLVSSGDPLNLKYVVVLLRSRALAVSHHNTCAVVCVGAYEVRASRHVALYGPIYVLPLARAMFVCPSFDLELACLVLGEVVHRLPPPTVHLTHRRVAQLHLHSLVR